MRKSMCKYQACLLVGALLFLVSFSYGQDGMHKPSKKTQKGFDAAVEAYMANDAALALELVSEAIERDPLYFDAWMLHAQLTERIGDFGTSAQSMSNAMELKPAAREKWGLKWCGLLHRSGQYIKALEIWDSLSDDVIDASRTDHQLLEASLLFSVQTIAEPEDVVASPLKGDVNTNSAEYYPAIFVSSDRMIFTRQVGADGRFQGQEDFYEAREVNGLWQDMGPIRGVNTRGNEGAPAVRGDGRRLIFTACETLKDGYGPRQGKGSCDLFETRWNPSTQRYEEEVNLSALNTRYWESQPSLSADGSQIFFVRAQRNEAGEMEQDIWFSTRLNSGEWGKPQRLTDTINTPGREENPVLHPDGNTLYFASDGHPGLGGLDLFVARKSEAGEWMAPVNLGCPINTNGDENSLQVFPNGRRALFASDRNQPGNLDLWEFELPEKMQAEEVFQWSGHAFNVVSGLPVQAEVVVLNSAGVPLFQMVSDPKDGMFSLPIVKDEVLTLQVSHPNYAFYNRSWVPRESEADRSNVVVEIPMTPLEVGTVFLLRDVHFETNSAMLDEVFQPELKQLLTTLLGANIRIQIIGHTDDQGTEGFNMELSKNRATSVSTYLHSNGIEWDRMEIRGKGSLEPLVPNDSEANRALNRRTEIIVID